MLFSDICLKKSWIRPRYLFDNRCVIKEKNEHCFYPLEIEIFISHLQNWVSFYRIFINERYEFNSFNSVNVMN